ncbi:MAG: cobyric acid synthase, partial [Candidatus Omnitrophica bacterium]|nr:cobyric acid synthase [Candidatus Omnitrophota bacterium]
MREKAKAIQIVGTGSGVGKSVLVAGICRMLTQEGYKVAPFKAQNMALNSAVTPDGLEIGRAQAMQAAACGIEPCVDMNPVLLKPTSNVGSQVIVHGKPVGNMSAVEYYKYKSQIWGKIKQSLNRLLAANDIVVIEGAGSPVEVNLKKHDIVNMKIARHLKCPVILVGDIDCGGVFAWLLGTLGLMPNAEKKLIKGFIINKFRGDKNLLTGGLRFLERRSGKKVLGVVPYYTDIKLPEEDSLFFDTRKKDRIKKGRLNIVVIKLPHIANFTDFDILEREQGINVCYTLEKKQLSKADCVILPGSKNTLADLAFIGRNGIGEMIKKKAARGCSVVGICGGYQMLGTRIEDPYEVESGHNKVNGLDILKIVTVLEKEKELNRVCATNRIDALNDLNEGQIDV